MFSQLLPLALLASKAVSAYDPTFAFNKSFVQETRSLDELYAAALAEGNTITVWHGGDEKTQQNSLKTAFEARFPGLTLNVTVDLSKYHDQNLDRQLATNNVYVDSIILQTLNDYPRWASQGALLNYAPAGFDKIFKGFKDEHAAYYGLFIIGWSNIVSANKTGGEGPKEYPEWLNPEWKNKLVLTYPNDDDAVLFAFNLILQQYGEKWFDDLLAQNPRWVRGTATPATLIASANTSYTGTFTSSIGSASARGLNVSRPTNGSFVTWPQTGAILKDAPHPEGAKLLHNWMLSEQRQKNLGTWSVREDIPGPNGLPDIMNMPGTDPTAFGRWMQDRAQVERLRFFFESKIGSAQGLSPLEDGI